MSKAAPRPTKAAHRYWRGKPDAAAIKAAQDEEAGSDSELSSDDQGDARGLGRKKLQTEAERAAKEGIQIVSGDLGGTLSEAAKPSSAAPAIRPVKSEAQSDQDAEEASVSSGSEESSEEESSSEEEESFMPLAKPVFVSKRQRNPAVLQSANGDLGEQAELQRQAEIEAERQKSHKLVSQTLSKEMAEKDAQEKLPDVDDTDGIDPAAEFEAWKLRELQRLKRDADAREAREAEKEEIEARRAMPEHLRLKEDMDRANESRQRARGGQAFLSKYHHSGVFYAEDERTRELMERERRNKVEMQDQVLDMASLPKMMQVRDFGKRSRTKHTHLRDVDTTSQEAGWAKGKSGGGNACFNCGQTGHVKRDCPNRTEPEASGSGAGPSGHARSRPRSRSPPPPRERDRRRSDWGHHDDVRSPPRRRHRSRSRSPPSSSRGGGRQRSNSPDYAERPRGTRRDRDDSRERAYEKRRRYD